MTARIVLFGTDDFNRLRAFRDAGYSVDHCATHSEFRLIPSLHGKIDAIAITETEGAIPASVISLARAHSNGSLILFQGRISHANKSDFNLVVPLLAPPARWLKEIGELIEKNRTVRSKAEIPQNGLRTVHAEPQGRQEQSKTLRVQLPLEDARTAQKKQSGTARRSSIPFLPESGILQNVQAGYFLKSLSQEMLAELETASLFSTCPAGTVLFVEGQPPHEIFFLIEGHVKLYMNSNDGKRLTVHFAGPGEVLGLPAAFTSAPHRASAETLYPTKIASVCCADFMNFMLFHPRAIQAAARELGDLCDRTYTRLRTIGVTPSNRAKLARLLLEWSAQGRQTEHGPQIRLALKHGDIAECIGTCRESVTRILRDLQRWQVIEFHGSLLTILDTFALEQCAELK